MKTYTGTTKCPHCGKEFNWRYTDDGYRPGKYTEYIAELSMPLNTHEAIAKHVVVIPNESEFLTMHCPFCQADVAVECSECMMKELRA